jgi:hypothetical protein
MDASALLAAAPSLERRTTVSRAADWGVRLAGEVSYRSGAALPPSGRRPPGADAVAALHTSAWISAPISCPIVVVGVHLRLGRRFPLRRLVEPPDLRGKRSPGSPAKIVLASRGSGRRRLAASRRRGTGEKGPSSNRLPGRNSERAQVEDLAPPGVRPASLEVLDADRARHRCAWKLGEARPQDPPPAASESRDRTKR